MKEREEVSFEKKQVQQDRSSRDYRLDLIKALSISLVLFLHLRPIRIIIEETSSSYAKTASFVLDQIYITTTSIAVPLFILTSLFLFLQKLRTSGIEYLKKRCRRLLEIFIFWSGVHFLVYYLVSFFISIQSDKPFSWSIPKLRIYKVIAGVDPALPIVGDSVFYFIFVLVLLIIASYLLFYNRTEQFKTYVSVAIIIASLLYFEILSLIGENIEYWRVDNFIIYVPITYLFIKNKGRLLSRYNLAIYSCFLIFGLQDIFLRAIQKDIGLYGRVSVVCGAVAVFSTCLSLKPLHINRSIEFLSRFSLGIFAVHKYWLLLATAAVLELFQLSNWSTRFSVVSLEVNIPSILGAIITLFFTFISVYFLDRSPLKRFIR